MPTPAHEHRGSHLSWTTVPNRPPLFFARAEARVLMPDDQPIGLRRLIEEGGAKGKCRWTQHRLRQAE